MSSSVPLVAVAQVRIITRRLLIASIALSLLGTTAQIVPLCPASEAIAAVNLKTPSLFTYPLDIYAPTSSTSSSFPQEHYNCTSKDEPFRHVCAYSSVCPHHAENILRGASLTTWEVAHSLACFTADSKVIILGGSVTGGVFTEGCCCDPRHNIWCRPRSSNCGHSKRHVFKYNHFCVWGTYFREYLNSKFAKHSNYHLIAKGGYDSFLRSTTITDDLIEQKIVFKNGDVIFLDASVNDALSHECDLLREGLDMLIEEIFKYTPGVFPTVILLNMWSDDMRVDYPDTSDCNYMQIYKDLAEHYRIPLWSLSDAMQTRSEPFSSYIHFMQNFRNSAETTANKPNPIDIHPPWHVHLFYADFVASLLERELQLATTSSCGSVVPLHHQSLAPHAKKSCASNEVQVVRASFLKNTLAEGSSGYTVVTSESWRHIEDRPQKFGLVSEFSQAKDDRVVIFDIDMKLLLASPSKQYTLLIKYMRTYKNAGIVNLSVCNQQMGSLDALWPDYSTNVFTKSDVYALVLDRDLIAACELISPTTISVQHVFIHDPKDESEKAARGLTQKFKLESVSLCPTVSI